MNLFDCGYPIPSFPFSQFFFFYFIRNTRERLIFDGQLLLVVCVSINVMFFLFPP